jgi:hypothetical protein
MQDNLIISAEDADAYFKTNLLRLRTQRLIVGVR